MTLRRAVAGVATELSDLRALFVDEAREYVQLLNDGMLRLEAQPSDQGVLHELFRAAHSLKGMAATVGLQAMVELAHALESALDRFRSGSGELQPDARWFDLLFDCTALMEQLVDQADPSRDPLPEGDLQPQVTRLVKALQELIDPGAPAGEAGPPARGTTPGNRSHKPAKNRRSNGSGGETARPAPAAPETSSSGEPGGQHPLWFLDAASMEQARQAQAQGIGVWRVDVRLASDCVFKGARAFTVLRALESVASVLGCYPAREALLEERFEDGFAVALVSPRPQGELQAALDQVPDVREARWTMAGAVELPAAPQAAASPPPAGTAGQAAAGPAASQRVAPRESTVRVETGRLDALVDLVGELVITTNQLQDAWQSQRLPDESQVRKLTRVTSDLQSSVMRLRMVPLKQVFSRFPRSVRDLARRFGKQVRFVVEGEETELDRNIVNEIGDPLLHLLRNAIDHGIELPDVRVRAGKPPEGLIRLSAYHEGNHVVIELEDDGAGIDVERIRQKALAIGRLTPEQAQTASSEDLLQLIFEPGFSTASQLTDVSGRGVGMDAAKTAVESLGGRLSVHTRPGRGTLCVIRLPLTLAVIRALLVECAGEIYALPAEVVSSIERAPQQPERVRGRAVLRYRGRVVSLVPLHERLGLPAPSANGSGSLAVVLASGRRWAAIEVERVVGLREVVIRNLSGYASVPGVAGATILGSGRVALILDAVWLV